MSLFHETAERLSAIENELGDNATADQRIAIAQAWAILSVNQELILQGERGGSDHRRRS